MIADIGTLPYSKDSLEKYYEEADDDYLPKYVEGEELFWLGS